MERERGCLAVCMYPVYQRLQCLFTPGCPSYILSRSLSPLTLPCARQSVYTTMSCPILDQLSRRQGGKRPPSKPPGYYQYIFGFCGAGPSGRAATAFLPLGPPSKAGGEAGVGVITAGCLPPCLAISGYGPATKTALPPPPPLHALPLDVCRVPFMPLFFCPRVLM